MEKDILEIKQGDYYVRIPTSAFTHNIIKRILKVFEDLDKSRRKKDVSK